MACLGGLSPGRTLGQPRGNGRESPLTMPALWDDIFQYETDRVLRIQSTNYGTIKWILHMIVFSYVR